MRHRLIELAPLLRTHSPENHTASAEELDVVLGDTARDLEATARPREGIIISFAELGYINSSHLAQLLRLRKKLTDRGCPLILCDMSDQIWSTVHLTGLDRVFRIVATARDAQSALALAPSE